MEPILVHEYFRILVPAVFFVGILKLLLPSQLPHDAGELLIISIGVGLLMSPIFDRLAKRAFHRRVIAAKFYERFIGSFMKHYRIKAEEVEGSELLSFSGPLKIPYSQQAESLLDVYKLFSRQGWGTEEEKYRVRMEKSFGILYYSLFCYSCIAFGVSLIYPLLKIEILHPVLGRWYLDLILFSALIFISWRESNSRFRGSLENEILILRGHFKELKTYYDSFDIHII